MSRRCEELAGKNRGAPRSALNFAELLGALGVLTRGLEKELGIYLNNGEKVVQLVCDVAGGPVRFFELARPIRRIRWGWRGDSFALSAFTACALFQCCAPREMLLSNVAARMMLWSRAARASIQNNQGPPQ